MTGKKMVLVAMAAAFVASQAQAAKVDVVNLQYIGQTGLQNGSPQNLINDDLTSYYKTGLTPWQCQPDSFGGVYTFIFTFDQPYYLDTINIWNLWYPSTGRTFDGAKNIDIYISPTDDPADFGTPLDFELERTRGAEWVGNATPEQAYSISGLNVLEMFGAEAMMVKLVIKDCWAAGEVIHGDHPGGAEREYHPFGADRGTGLNAVAFFGTAVPEPATMSLLALGGLALLRRRR